MTSIRIMCDQSDGTTVSLGAIKTDSDCTIIYSAHPSLIDGKFRDPVTLALLRWIGRLEQFSQITNQQDKDDA